jgi:hypothetical protein
MESLIGAMSKSSSPNSLADTLPEKGRHVPVIARVCLRKVLRLLLGKMRFPLLMTALLTILRLWLFILVQAVYQPYKREPHKDVLLVIVFLEQ